MFKRLPIALVETGNASENLLNEICQIVYSLNQAKEFAKRVHNHITNSAKF